MPPVRLAIVVPVRNEASGIVDFLQALQDMRKQGHKIIVVDGGSVDETATFAESLCDSVLHAPPGRASQMNAGAHACTSEILLFLHADTFLPADAIHHIENATDAGAVWGRFDVKIQGRSRWLPVIGAMMNLRSRITGIATGDQGIFVNRATFDAVGGFANVELMEDIDLCKRLRAVSHPACLRAKVTTSGRRWDQRGAVSTMVLMWRLRWRYWRGESAAELAKAYR